LTATYGRVLEAAQRELARHGTRRNSPQNGAVSLALPPQEWEPPTPLHLENVPDFPVSALPASLGQYVEAVAAFAEVPADLPGVLALAVVSAAVGGRARVEVRPGYVEPVTLFVAVAVPPGERKSAVFTALTRPLHDEEARLLQRAAPDIAEARSRFRVREKELANAERKAAEGGSDRQKWDSACRDLARLIREEPVPAEPRLIAADVTPEQVAHLLAEQGGRLAILSPEGGELFGLLRRYSRSGAANFEVFLKGHAGDQIRVDRRSSAPVSIPNPALTVGLAVQPSVIRGLMCDQDLRDRGLLARFLYSVPAVRVGHRTFDGPAIPSAVTRRYEEAVTALCAWGGQATPFTFDAEALPCWYYFARVVELGRQPGGRFAALLDWSGKLPGLVARLAGVLHVASHAGGVIPENITVDTIRAAVSLGEYAADHARAAHALMGADPAQEGARILLDWLERTVRQTFTKRDAHSANRGHFPRADALSDPLAELESRGWIRAIPIEARAGRPSEQYDVHPDVWMGDGND